MEIWDGYNKDRTLAGIDLIREEEFTSDSFPKGLYHLVADVIVLHTDGSFLVMQRDLKKEGHPGEWEIGAGGSVLKGETAYDGAVRELYEETGIVTDKLIPLDIITTLHNNGVGVHYYIYLCITDMDKDKVKLQEGETIDHKWLSSKEILCGDFIPQRRINIIQMLDDSKCIITERLLLRPLCADDLDTVHQYASDAEITRFMMNLPNDKIEESKGFIDEAIKEWNKSKPSYYEYAVVFDGYQIGGVCLYLTDDRKQGELGWILNPGYHGKGYAKEAASAVIHFAERLGLEAVFARCDIRNTPSEMLMRSLGMILESDDGTRCYEKKNETAGELKYSLVLI